MRRPDEPDRDDDPTIVQPDDPTLTRREGPAKAPVSQHKEAAVTLRLGGSSQRPLRQSADETASRVEPELPPTLNTDPAEAAIRAGMEALRRSDEEAQRTPSFATMWRPRSRSPWGTIAATGLTLTGVAAAVVLFFNSRPTVAPPDAPAQAGEVATLPSDLASRRSSEALPLDFLLEPRANVRIEASIARGSALEGW